jgi:hypothetical protein
MTAMSWSFNQGIFRHSVRIPALVITPTTLALEVPTP